MTGTELIHQRATESMQDGIVVSHTEGPQVERLNYGTSCKGIDFGLLNARNQLIKTVVNPLLDMILKSVMADRALRGGSGLKQRFVVNVVVTAERDADGVN